MEQFTRTVEGEKVTTLNLTDAVEQFIRDEGAFLKRDDEEIAELLEDMPAVFETQHMLKTLDVGEDITSGIATFKRIA